MTVQFKFAAKAYEDTPYAISYGPFQYVKEPIPPYASSHLYVDGIPVQLTPAGNKIIELLIERQGHAVTFEDLAEKIGTKKAKEALEYVNNTDTDARYSSHPFYNILKVHMSNIRRDIIKAVKCKKTGQAYGRWITGLDDRKAGIAAGTYKLMLPEEENQDFETPDVLKNIFTKAGGQPISYGNLILIPGNNENFADAKLTIHKKPRNFKLETKAKQMMALLIDAQGGEVPLNDIMQAMGTQNKDTQTSRAIIKQVEKSLVRAFALQTHHDTAAYTIERVLPLSEKRYMPNVLEAFRLAPVTPGMNATATSRASRNKITVNGVTIPVWPREARLFELVSKNGNTYSMETFCQAVSSPANLRSLHEMQSAQSAKEYRIPHDRAHNYCGVLLHGLKNRILEAFGENGLKPPKMILKSLRQPSLPHSLGRFSSTCRQNGQIAPKP